MSLSKIVSRINENDGIVTSQDQRDLSLLLQQKRRNWNDIVVCKLGEFNVHIILNEDETFLLRGPNLPFKMVDRLGDETSPLFNIFMGGYLCSTLEELATIIK